MAAAWAAAWTRDDREAAGCGGGGPVGLLHLHLVGAGGEGEEEGHSAARVAGVHLHKRMSYVCHIKGWK